MFIYDRRGNKLGLLDSGSAADKSSGMTVLEVGAGDGRLTHFLRVALARQLLGGDGSIGAVAAATTAPIRVVATDSNERQLQTFYPVEVCTAEAALQKYQPVQFCSP